MQTERHNEGAGTADVNLACFEVQGRLYALEVSQVREIVRAQRITPLPNSPALIEGVVDLRGRVIPVVDLSRVLGLSSSAMGTAARIVVLETEELVLGLVVEAATDVLSVKSIEMEDPPQLATDAGYDAVRHVVRREGQDPVMVLSLEHILENVYRSKLGNAAPPGCPRQMEQS